MALKALGLIEVRGMLSAIIAADATLKTADVNLLGNQKVRGGLTTVQIFGDVAAVEAAIEAGVNALKGSDSLISSHVIARLDEQVEKMLTAQFEKKQKSTDTTEVKVNANTATDDNDNVESSYPVAEYNGKVKSAEQSVNQNYTREELEKMKVTELRSLAYQNNISSISKADIKRSRKKELIDGLLVSGGTEE